MSQASGNEQNGQKLITFEDGVVTLAGEEVPGILHSLRVEGKVRFDEQKVDGSSGKKKTPQGFEDSDIMVSLYLVTDSDSSCYDKLETLSGMFRKVDDKANPQIYTVANRHLLARGVRQVVFSRLCSSENDRTDEIMATLGFVEHNPPVVKTEKAQAKSPTSKELAEQAKEKARQAAPKEDELIIKAE
ncbi:MAG: hypothetical protein ACLVI5_04555 [Desulfovibrio piger]|uniref:baseplate complex protein n=1 Tax=Desulfovibrio piger TaxID=901 RepID=UPI00399C1026